MFQTIVESSQYPNYDEKSETDVIVSGTDTGIGAHGDREYSFELKIPHNLLLPNFVKCQLLSQKFKLKVRSINYKFA